MMNETEIKTMARIHAKRVLVEEHLAPLDGWRDTIAYTLPDSTEVELLHTNDHPFCSNVLCPCHSDPELNQEFFMQPYMDGLTTKEEAVRIWYGRQL